MCCTENSPLYTRLKSVGNASDVAMAMTKHRYQRYHFFTLTEATDSPQKWTGDGDEDGDYGLSDLCWCTRWWWEQQELRSHGSFSQNKSHFSRNFDKPAICWCFYSMMRRSKKKRQRLRVERQSRDGGSEHREGISGGGSTPRNSQNSRMTWDPFNELCDVTYVLLLLFISLLVIYIYIYVFSISLKTPRL